MDDGDGEGDEFYYDDGEFDDDELEKIIGNDELPSDLRSSIPKIQVTDIIEDPNNISINYDDDSFSPTGFSPEKSLVDNGVKNWLPLSENPISDPKIEDCNKKHERDGFVVEDPNNISTNYDDDRDFSLSGLSEILVSASVLETAAHQGEHATEIVLGPDTLPMVNPPNEDKEGKEFTVLKPIFVPEPSTGDTRSNLFLFWSNVIPQECQLSLQVHKITASNLRNIEIVGQNDPYISLNLSNGYWSATTSVFSNGGSNVEWNIDDMHFKISIELLKSSVLFVQAVDANFFRKDTVIGTGEIAMVDGLFSSIDNNQGWLTLTIPLLEKGGQLSGTLTVVIRLTVVSGCSENSCSNIELLLQQPESRPLSEKKVEESTHFGEKMESNTRFSPLPTQLQCQTTDTETDTDTRMQGQILGSSSNQLSSEKLKELMEDATFRAMLFADTESNVQWNGDVLKLMKTAASKTIISAQYEDDNDSVDSNGCARGFGYKSITAGLKIADLRMKIRASGSSSALRRSMGVDAVRRLSTFVNSPKNAPLLAATASAAASALSPSQHESSLQSEEELQNMINSVLANLRRSFNIVIRDFTEDNSTVGTVESPKAFVEGHSSSSHGPNDSAVGYSVGSELERGNSSTKPVIQKLQRSNSAPSKSFKGLLHGASPRNTFNSENNILRMLQMANEKSTLLMLHKVSEKNIFKIIQSEHFIESSIYQWAKPKKAGVDSQQHTKSTRSEKKFASKAPAQPKKVTPVKTYSAAIALNMKSPIFYKKKRLMEAAQFAKSVAESGGAIDEGRWGGDEPLSSPVAHYRIVRLLENSSHGRYSDHEMIGSRISENDADNLKQTMAEMEQVTLRDIMRPLPELRKNMTWTDIATTWSAKKAASSPGNAVPSASAFDIAEGSIESKEPPALSVAVPNLNFSKASTPQHQTPTRAGTPSFLLSQSALGSSMHGRGRNGEVLFPLCNTVEAPTSRKRLPLLINVLSEKDLRKTRKAKV